MKADDMINFIKLYQLYPCLWNPLDDNYRNRRLKQEALNEISMLTGTSSLEVEKKIAICLSQNRRARRRAAEFRKVGMNERDIENSVWYGYRHLNFVNEVYAEMKSKQEAEESLLGEYEVEEEEKTRHSTEDENNMEDLLRGEANDISSPSTSKTTTNNVPTKSKRPRRMTDLDELVYETCKTIKLQGEENQNKDETQIFCEYIAKKMRNLDAITRRDVEHKINCVLYEAEIKILHDGTT